MRSSIPYLCIAVARRFTQMLRRQISLNQLCQAARTVTLSQDMVCQMVEDWGHIDLRSICRQTLYTMDSYSLADHDTVIKCKHFLIIMYNNLMGDIDSRNICRQTLYTTNSYMLAHHNTLISLFYFFI